MLKSMRLRTATALAAAAMGAVGSIAAIPATAALAASTSCYPGKDGRTGYTYCGGSAKRFRVIVECELLTSGNSHQIFGPWKTSSSTPSKATCGSSERVAFVGSEVD